MKEVVNSVKMQVDFKAVKMLKKGRLVNIIKEIGYLLRWKRVRITLARRFKKERRTRRNSNLGVMSAWINSPRVRTK